MGVWFAGMSVCVCVWGGDVCLLHALLSACTCVSLSAHVTVQPVETQVSPQGSEARTCVCVRCVSECCPTVEVANSDK